MVEEADSFGIVLDGANLRELELTCTLTDGRSFIFPAGDYSDSQAESINILLRPDGTGEVYRTGMHETGQMATMLTHTLKDALRWIM
ncbi:hypothetical protein GCM10007315_22270 [Gemmobacter tilapiae]|uniref:Uncharacterized protein n=2 Tax=Neogemmobacter tilapiae TaxID=875041 RepID=A0A918TR51_9RHOB|nr:hypothetical protein GCM10007315_22270 [Gemmobacter tilapiae]